MPHAANRSEGLSRCPAEGRILPDVHWSALHGADRRRVVEAQEEVEEAHGFDRRSEVQ
jgi:hypothetical protein